MRLASKECPKNGNRDSGWWRPKPEEQKYACGSANQIRKVDRKPRVFREMGRSDDKNYRARQHALQQKTSAGPALGE